MPLFIAALIGALVSAAGTLVGKVLISLGIGYVAYSGIDTMLESAKADVFSRIAGQGSLVTQLAGVLQIGTCINILASAYLARLVVAGLTNGKLTSMVHKG
ncbi:DUF2523 domain-containing protein [Hydrogenophaga sp.]|uniref:DUF2523 domain-containing protein n=1 Tax=Hydrogenophaga sp. TaxID=1904254 RepID=UPI0027356083|nr:DUF2523 domain-containing protein [Hydrogenophaga sp.]MDP3887126.1 DUF2523 domain-containing protein [Hydrogenophaga sp.]